MKKVFFRYVLFLLCLIFVVEIPFAFGWFHTMQEKITDRLFLNKPQSRDVVVVAIDDRSISEIGQWPWPRVTFAQVLDQLTKQETEKPKAIGIDVSFSESSNIGSVDDDALSRTFLDVQSRGVEVVLPIDLGANNQLISQPLPQFLPNTKQGFIVSPIDGDGTVRRAETRRGSYESFAHTLVSGTAPSSYRIDYRGIDGFVTVSFSDVLRGQIPARIFKDKIVLIGATAPNLHDFVATPFNQMPGVVLNANQVQTLIDKTFFHDLDPIFSFGALAFIALCVSLTIRKLKRIRTLSLTLAGLLFLIVIDASIAFG
ncbi:MAG: CHASE2 domain-containing protein, partial [Patescibacteria group bacterium]